MLEDISMASLVDSDNSDVEGLDNRVLSSNISFELPVHSSLQSLQASSAWLQGHNTSLVARGDGKQHRTPVKLPRFRQDEPVIWFEKA